MSTATLSADELALYTVLTEQKPATIAEVIAKMQAIDDLLANGDGLKWFNRLYLMVTQQVDLQPPGGGWKSPVWLTQLDVTFANLYFTAVADYLVGGTVASSWKALFEARFVVGIDRVQFALAGMNAHINHDLALALLVTDAEMGIVPSLTSAEYADYESVNTLLNLVMPAALTMLAVDTLGVLAEDTGKAGRVLAYWNMCQARDLAWNFADHLRGLAGPVRNAALDAQDGLTGALGRAILMAA
ncbi:DUF5995 family protein [Granulicella arctica]|uniref:DUF5995 family protein n=1 Tax=Granulicella arctica TaxID=940613 RepID=UPI0021E0E2D9|nr:DUF5995 family protein [Granulicella arctica]